MSSGPTKEQWNDVRKLLKEAILAGEIPLEPKQMRPKQIFEKFQTSPAMGCVDYGQKSTRDKLTRMIRTLRAKHKDGDLENEDKAKPVEWAKSAAKQHLKKCFREKLIPADYQDPKLVWTEHCQGKAAFARMEYNSAFTRRLASVRDDYIKKVERSAQDLAAFQAAKRNHPTPLLNRRGEPQWNGSEAQKLLKEIVSKGDHVNIKPAELREQYEVFKTYSKQTFRDHIYQEKRLIKFENWLEYLRKQKLESLQF